MPKKLTLVLALKTNHPTFYQQVQNWFDKAIASERPRRETTGLPLTAECGHGDQMVYMQNPGDGNYYSLGMFAKDSNKLPVSASFAGLVRMDGNTMDIYIKPGSIAIPEKEMPQSPKRIRSKHRRQEITETSKSNLQRLAEIKQGHKHQRQNLPKSSSKQVVTNLHFSKQPQLGESQSDQMEI